MTPPCHHRTQHTCHAEMIICFLFKLKHAPAWQLRPAPSPPRAWRPAPSNRRPITGRPLREAEGNCTLGHAPFRFLDFMLRGINYYGCFCAVFFCSCSLLNKSFFQCNFFFIMSRWVCYGYLCLWRSKAVSYGGICVTFRYFTGLPTRLCFNLLLSHQNGETGHWEIRVVSLWLQNVFVDWYKIVVMLS